MDCCEKLFKKICDDLAEDINSALCQKLKNHIKECKTCRDQLQSMRDTVNLFRCLEEKNVPVDIHQRLYKMLNVEET